MSKHMQQGINSAEMQKSNRNLVLKLLMENGSMTRSEIARQTGLQKATITNIINEFLELGILHTGQDSGSGHRGELLRLRDDSGHILSLDVNRKDYRICLFALDGSKVASLRKPLVIPDAAVFQAQLLSDVRSILRHAGQKGVLGACVGLPGPFIRREHTIALVSGSELLNSVDIPAVLEQALHIPMISEHDARLSAYAEWKEYEKTGQKSLSSLVTLHSIGQGVGCGIVVNGKMIRGHMGIAGEIGHMGINFNAGHGTDPANGRYEYYSGTESALRYVRERLFEFPNTILHEYSTYPEIMEAYRAGDPLAVYAMEKMAWMLGYGIANLVYLLNPDQIILGEAYPSYQPFLDRVWKSVCSVVHPSILEGCTLRFSQLEDSILLGGYHLVLEKSFRDNSILDYIRGEMSCSVTR